MTPDELTPDELTGRLSRLRARARAVLWVERVLSALAPAMALLCAALVAALFGLPSLLPPALHWGALTLFAVGMAWLVWRGTRRVHRPASEEIDRRLEANGGVPHQPLVVLADRPATTGTDAASLWQAHVRRATAQVAQLRAGWPRLGRSDSRAVGALLTVLMVVGLVVAGADAPGRVLAAAWPKGPLGPAAPAPLLQAWITPPSYTGLPPLFLRPEDASIRTPAGSRLTISLTGGSGEPSLTLGNAQQAFSPLDAASWQAERDVGEGGVLTVRRRGRLVAQWTLAIVPDHPPVVAWTEPPGSGQARRRLQIRLPWTVSDDYGVTSLQAELRLAARPGAEPLVVNIPLPGEPPKQAHGVQAQDLTANPWAGLPVVAVLVGKDAPGQPGRSQAAEFTLPERVFKNTVARALIDIRKRLSLTPEAHEQAGGDLAAIAEAPAAFDNNTSVFLGLSSAAGLLSRSGAPADIAEAQQRLWALALQLEDNAVSRTAQAIQAARDALKQESQRQQDREARREPLKPGEKTDMDRKAEALRQAIQKHLQALAEQARRDGTLMPFDPRSRTLNQRDFDKLTRQMQEDARAGRMDDARDKLAQLEQMLEQLKQAEANPGDRRQAQQQRRRGRQQMGAAEDMVQRETGFKGHADHRSDDQPATMDAAQQRALRRALGEMMQQFGDLTGKVPEGLSEADLAMRDAATALSDGDDPRAAAAQQHAIEALQKGEQQMSQQMATSLGISVQPGEGEGQGQPGDQLADGDGDGEGDGMGEGQAGNEGGRGDLDGEQDPGQRAGDEPRDPLGRSTRDGLSGRADGGNVQVPQEMERARTRDIQTELRRRGAERTRPPGELDYIDRLLKAF